MFILSLLPGCIYIVQTIFTKSYVQALIANLQSYDEEAVTLALGDEHPAIVFEGVRGCFEGWESFGSDLRLSLQAIVRRTFEKIAVVACANRFVVDFGDSDGFGGSKWGKAYRNKSAAKWLLWAEVVPVFLRTISAHSVWINQANLWHTTQQAREHLNPEIGLSVCQGWLDWIEAKLKHSLPDDYGFALAQFLIEVTRNAPAVRSKLSAHLLSHSDTAFLLSNLKEYLTHWPDLTTAEHELVLSLCGSNRKDNRWIRALPPTRENPPPGLAPIWWTGSECMRHGII